MSFLLSSIDGHTKILGLIGRGIAHTLSPFIHNRSIAYLGINACYLPFDFQGGFPDRIFFQAMWDMGVLGFNITVPFKESAAELFPSGPSSVNTLYRGEYGFQAASTDGKGFVRGMEAMGLQPADFERIILLGYGGAAKALEQTFAGLAPHVPLLVLKRNPEAPAKAQHPCVSFLPFTPDALIDALQKSPRSLIVQTTSAPLKGESLPTFTPALSYCEGAFVDLVYGSPSALLSSAERLKLPCQDGIPMLIAQALLAQELWWGRSAPYDLIERELRTRIKSSG